MKKLNYVRLPEIAVTSTVVCYNGRGFSLNHAPPTMSGPSFISCTGSTSYSVSSPHAVTSYSWNVSSHLDIISGQGTNTITAKKYSVSTMRGITEFNVSTLPDNIYYLHIYDGVYNTPEIQQISVEH